MMKNINYKIIFLVALLLLVAIPKSYAVFKLDFISPGTDAAEIIQKGLEKVEKKYTDVLELQNIKILAAGGQEGSALYKTFVTNPAAALFEHGAGQLLGRGSSSSVLDVLQKSILTTNVDIADLEQRKQDFIKAGEAAKMSKYQAIIVQKTELEAKWKAINTALVDDPDNQDLLKQQEDLSKQIAELEGQARMVLQEDVQNTVYISNLEGKIGNLRTLAGSLGDKLKAENTLSFLDKQADNFEAEDKEAVGELYDSNIYRFFISDEDLKDTENVAKVKLERDKEYYKSVKHMWENIASTYINLTKTDETAKACADLSVQADSIFGAQAMQICADLQNAKAAAQYMEMMLSELRFESIMQIKNWTDKLQLRDSSHDVTKFNLDYYKLTKSDKNLVKKAIKEAKKKAKEKAKEFTKKNAQNFLGS